MKKRLLSVLLFLMLVLCMTGCGGNKRQESVKEGRVNLKDLDTDKIVTMAEYKGLKMEIADVTIADETVDEAFREFYIENFDGLLGTNRPAQLGDTVNIDYEGKKDGVAFPSGMGQGCNLTLGSHQFIPGFEEGLVGVSPNQTVELNLSFPKNYDNLQLAGQNVVFNVKVHYIIPEEPMDEAIARMGIDGVRTEEQLREFVYDNLYEQALLEERLNAQNAVIASYVDNCKYDNIPPKLITQYRETLIHDISQTAAEYELDVSSFIERFYGMDADKFLDDYAMEVSKEFLSMQAIANKENLNVSDEELQRTLEERAENVGAASVEEFLGETDKEVFREYLMTDKVIAFIVENVRR